MKKTEFFFEQVIKFRGYTLKVYGNTFLSVTLTKDTCPILSFEFSTNLANPKNPTNKPWKSSKLLCKDKKGNLCLDLCSKRIEKMVIRIPWNIINPIMDGVTKCFASAPEGLIKHFIISAADDDNKDFSCSYAIVHPQGYGETHSSGSFGGKNKISLWMLYRNPGEKHSVNDENVLVREIISFCNKNVSLEIEKYQKLLAKIEARNNYVRSKDDEKVFLFSDNNYRLALTEGGLKIACGIAFSYDGADNFFESNINELKKYLAQEYWQFFPVVATADNEEAMKVLDLFIEHTNDYSLNDLIEIRSYMKKSKVCA